MSGKFTLKGLLAALALAGLAACGHHPADRAISGAAVGAAVGAVGAAATDHNVGAGALVGGLVGGAVGVATTPRRRYRDRHGYYYDDY